MGATVRTTAVAEDRESSDPERADQPPPGGDPTRPWFPPTEGQPPTGFTEPPASPGAGGDGGAALRPARGTLWAAWSLWAAWPVWAARTLRGAGAVRGTRAVRAAGAVRVWAVRAAAGAEAGRYSA